MFSTKRDHEMQIMTTAIDNRFASREKKNTWNLFHRPSCFAATLHEFWNNLCPAQLLVDKISLDLLLLLFT